MTKLRLISLSSCVLMSLGTVGCGPTENADVNETVAKQQVFAAVDALMQIKGGKSGDVAVASLMPLGIGSMSMLTPREGNEKRSADLAAQTIVDLTNLARAEGSDKCSCDENKCVFKNCDLTGFGSLDGTMEWSDTSLKCDYKAEYSIDEGGMKLKTSFSTFCNLSYSDTSLEGELSSKGSIETSGHGHDSNVSWESSYDFVGIKFDDKGAVQSGIAKVEVEVKGNGKDALFGKSEIDFASK